MGSAPSAGGPNIVFRDRLLSGNFIFWRRRSAKPAGMGTLLRQVRA
jgi:hypothetical protein